MKHITLMSFLFLVVSSTYAVERSVEDGNNIQYIETEYAKVIQNIFIQVEERLTKGEDITDIKWLSEKNKAEFKEIKNLISDLNIIICFNKEQKKEVREKLKKTLDGTIREELDKIGVINDIKAEAIEDFLYVSSLVCGLTLESERACRSIMNSFKEENRVFLEKLKIIEHANLKIKELERKEDKKEKKRTLYEHIVLGTAPRK